MTSFRRARNCCSNTSTNMACGLLIGPRTMSASIASAADCWRTTYKMGNTISAGVSAELRVKCSKAVLEERATSRDSLVEDCILFVTVSVTRGSIIPDGLASSAWVSGTSAGGTVSTLILFSHYWKILFRFGHSSINSRSSWLYNDFACLSRPSFFSQSSYNINSSFRARGSFVALELS